MKKHSTTICMLEVLLEHERAVGGSPVVMEARLRGEEHLLERQLFRCRSTGEVIERDRKGDATYRRIAFPTWWHYDGGGWWPLETRYPSVMPVEIDEGEGRPNRWNMLRALRVLTWYSAGD